MQIHQIQRTNPNKKKVIIGRGGVRGKTSGKGTKGQKSRAGHKIRPAMRDIIKKIPKKRGYKFASIEIKPAVINVSVLDQRFDAGSIIEPSVLVTKGLIKRNGGKIPQVKILAKGDLSKKLTFKNCLVSVGAKEKIEKAGGNIVG